MATTQAPAKPTRASLEKRLADLNGLKLQLLQEQLALEKQGLKPVQEDAARRHIVDAMALFEGVAGFERPSTSRQERLWEVMDQCEIVQKAIEYGTLRLTKLLHEQADEIAVDIEAAWKKNVLATVTAIGEFKRLAAERERLRQEWCARTGLPVWPACYVEGAVMSLTGPNTPIGNFLETAQRCRLIEKEKTK